MMFLIPDIIVYVHLINTLVNNGLHGQIFILHVYEYIIAGYLHDSIGILFSLQYSIFTSIN